MAKDLITRVPTGLHEIGCSVTAPAPPVWVLRQAPPRPWSVRSQPRVYTW